jgi:hypothetical protein
MTNSHTLKALAERGIDLGAPAPFTLKQIEVIEWQLSIVDGEAAKVVSAALQGYAESALLHPSTGIQSEAKSPKDDPDTIQWAAHSDMTLADAMEAFDSDGELYDWLVSHIEQAFKVHNAGKQVITIGQPTGKLDQVDAVAEIKAVKHARKGSLWIVAVLAGALVVACAVQYRR